MNALKNRVQLIGHLGKDPQVKHLQGEKVVAQFSLATSESYKNKQGERVEDTQWHQVVVWGKLAEITERFLQKGMKVAIEGKLTYRSYEDKQGVQRYVTEIVAQDLLMLDKKGEPAEKKKELVEDELPF